MTVNGSPTPTARRDTSNVLRVGPSSGAIRGPAALRADAVVRGLSPSSWFGLAVWIYRLHERDDADRCVSDVSRTWRSRTHAAAVITAAGIYGANATAPTRRGSNSRRLQSPGTAAGRRSSARVRVARSVRSRPSAECRGLTRPCGWRARSRRDQLHGREAVMAAQRPLASESKETPVYRDLAGPARLSNPYPRCGPLFCRRGAPFGRWSSPTRNAST